MSKITSRKALKYSLVLNFLGVDPILLYDNLRGLKFYFRDLSELKRQKGDDTTFHLARKNPRLTERFSPAGTMSGHYFHQDLFVARKIFLNQPARHLDIGSRIDGFVAHVAAFRDIEIIDIREQIKNVKNIWFRKADLMKLPTDMVDAYDSISSLHAIEHFGLGRYGDPIDYWGYLKGIENISRLLKKGGTLYFSVPIGTQRIEFNSHRVFSVEYLLDIFKNDYSIKSFSFVNDSGDFFENVELSQTEITRNYGCQYGCGIFELIKIA